MEWQSELHETVILPPNDLLGEWECYCFIRENAIGYDGRNRTIFEF